MVPMDIKRWLNQAAKKLSTAGIDSARLDVEILLSASLYKSREYLLAHSDQELSDTEIAQVDKWLHRRIKREPIAYIVEHKEFYGRDFIVSPNVLIPRPESELIIEVVKQHNLNGRVLDVGCGSGCLGLSLKAEIPSIELTLSDISPSALDIARKNAKKLGIKPVRYIASDLLGHWLGHNKPKPFNLIVANLPYVDKSWEVSPETRFEPNIALFSGDQGLDHINRLIRQARSLVLPGGHLLLEADPRQHQNITDYAKEHGFLLVSREGFIALYTLRA